MKGFGFSLADNTSLRESPDGSFLVSRVPMRILRLNKPLFRLLRHLQDGGELSEFISQSRGFQEGQLLRVLLSLTSRGYLKLDRIVEIEDYPGVSIIIPVRDQPEDLTECLQSLSNLDYPKDKLEIIVVDDGSRSDISQTATMPGVSVIRQANSQGPAACRNIGAEEADGDILAFLDADCMAGENWLRELVPFFRTTTVGAVGGYVDGYYKESLLDRYEVVSSSLNMGKRLLLEGRTESGFYVPTANMLVSSKAFVDTDGFKGSMRVGEDVDFCWRMRNLGYTLLYVPFGRVAHKHRNHLGSMLRRRSEYGTSEAGLYQTHWDRKKKFVISIYAGLSFLALALAILLMNPYPLIAVPLVFGFDMVRRYASLKKFKMSMHISQTVYSTFRSYLSFFYFSFFHLVRYYLILILGLGFLLHSLWLFGGLAILYTSIVDYHVKKPGLNYPAFLFFYLLEHLAYQVGVFWGCLKLRYFGSYLVSFKRA